MKFDINMMTKLTNSVQLQPDEQAVYVALKLWQKEHNKMPSISELRGVLGPKTNAIVSRMKKKGLLPRGRFDLGVIEGKLRENVKSVPVQYVSSQDQIRAKILVVKLKSRLDRMNGGKLHLPRQWFGRQMAIAKQALKDDDTLFIPLRKCIDWVFEQSYLAPHAVNMYKILEYFPKYQVAQNAAPNVSPGRIISGHEQLWKEGAITGGSLRSGTF